MSSSDGCDSRLFVVYATVLLRFRVVVANVAALLYLLWRCSYAVQMVVALHQAAVSFAVLCFPGYRCSCYFYFGNHCVAVMPYRKMVTRGVSDVSYGSIFSEKTSENSAHNVPKVCP